jgi:hypothetical protein
MSFALMRLPERNALYDQYLALSRLADTAFAGQLGGKLLLRGGFDPPGIAVGLAASIAGAASLCVESDAELLRQGMRAGFCDFVVGHLDEALRILKNELRRARPISVGLTADPEICLAEIVARGLQPDLLSSPALASPGWDALVERGTIPLPPCSSQQPPLSFVEWSVDPAASMPAIARVADAALDPQRPDTTVRRRWLERSPAYLGRALGGRQCLRMTPSEIAAFVPAVRSQFPSPSITVDGADE